MRTPTAMSPIVVTTRMTSDTSGSHHSAVPRKEAQRHRDRCRERHVRHDRDDERVVIQEDDREVRGHHEHRHRRREQYEPDDEEHDEPDHRRPEAAQADCLRGGGSASGGSGTSGATSFDVVVHSRDLPATRFRPRDQGSHRHDRCRRGAGLGPVAGVSCDPVVRSGARAPGDDPPRRAAETPTRRGPITSVSCRSFGMASIFERSPARIRSMRFTLSHRWNSTAGRSGCTPRSSTPSAACRSMTSNEGRFRTRFADRQRRGRT